VCVHRGLEHLLRGCIGPLFIRLLALSWNARRLRNPGKRFLQRNLSLATNLLLDVPVWGAHTPIPLQEGLQVDILSERSSKFGTFLTGACCTAPTLSPSQASAAAAGESGRDKKRQREGAAAAVAVAVRGSQVDAAGGGRREQRGEAEGVGGGGRREQRGEAEGAGGGGRREQRGEAEGVGGGGGSRKRARTDAVTMNALRAASGTLRGALEEEGQRRQHTAASAAVGVGRVEREAEVEGARQPLRTLSGNAATTTASGQVCGDSFHTPHVCHDTLSCLPTLEQSLLRRSRVYTRRDG
jgi:hypothetical protein